MIKDFMSLDNILVSFETVLKIDYQERDTSKLINNSIQKLESAFKIRIDKDLYSLQAQNEMLNQNISNLLQDIFSDIKTLALYTTCQMFNRSITISLADVNYLGFPKSQLTTVLKYLQDREYYEQRKEYIQSITPALTNIEVCTVKRLFVVLLVLERLGVSEGVCVVAQYLYLGGLVV